MGSVNSCTFVGNLGKDAELRYIPSGEAVASFSMACSETWKDKQGQKQERTEWVRIVLWGKTAEALTPYLKKGKQVYVVGRMQTRQWDDKEGIKRYTTEIRGDRVVLLGGGPRSDDGGAPATTTHASTRSGPSTPPDLEGVPDDDIPF